MKYNSVEFWDHYAVHNKRAWNKPENYYEMDNLIGWIETHTALESSVLDVGSGWGRFWLRCQEKGLKREISMCDISTEYIEQTLVNTGIIAEEWDGNTLPYEDNNFDFVVAQSVLLHVKPYLIKRVFRELVRVSKNYIYIAAPNIPCTLERMRADRKEGTWCFAHDYSGMIKASGLTIVDSRKFSGLRMAWLLQK